MPLRPTLTILVVISLLFGVAGSASAQTHQALVGGPIPMDFPTEVTAPTFGVRGAMALNENGAIWSVTGMPPEGNWAVQKIQPSGPDAMAGPWIKLAKDVALYESVQGELVLVRDLPDNPTLVFTGLLTPLNPYTPVNDTTAVFCGQGAVTFTVLRHGPAGATLHGLASPIPLQFQSRFRCGPSGADRFLAPGGISNREIAVLEGLSGPPSGFAVTTRSFAAGPLLEGFCVTEVGTAVGWHTDLQANMHVSVGRVTSTGFTHQNVYTFDPPGTGGPWTPNTIDPARGDDVVMKWWDDVIGVSNFVIDIRQNPVRALTWDDDVPGRFVTFPASRQVVEMLDLLAWNPYARYHRFTRTPAGQATTTVHELQHLFVPGIVPEDAFRVNEDTLVIVSNDGLFPGTTRFVSVYSDVDGVADRSTFVLNATGPMGVFPLSSGLFAGISSPGPGLSSEVHAWTAPAAYLLTTPGQVFFNTALHLTPMPSVPRVGGPFSIGIQGQSLNLSDVWLVAATDVGPPVPLGPPFETWQYLHLDLQAFLGLVPATPLGPIDRAVNFDLQTAPVEALGQEIFFQAVGYDSQATGFVLSDPLVVIPG